MLQAETPAGWVSTGFPAADIKDAGFVKFRDAYQTRFHELPKASAFWSYNAIHALAAAIKEAKSDDPAKIRDALETVSYSTPLGEEHFRKIDHQATTAMWVGETGVENGQGKLLKWTMEKADDNSPPDAWIKSQRAANGGDKK